MVPSNYVQIVASNDSEVDQAGVPPTSSYVTCPFQARPSSASTERHRGSLSNKTTGGSQSTLNTICSYHSSRKSQHGSIVNRLYNSDPSTNMIGTQSQVIDDSEYLTDYAHIKHSHRHPHYHFRRQSQPEEPRLISRNSSLKSFTSQSYNNPEYFYDIRPSRSVDDSKASLISKRPSNHIMWLTSDLHLLNGGLSQTEHSQSYPKINHLDKTYLMNEPLTKQAEPDSTTSTEGSDTSEFHESKHKLGSLEKARESLLYSDDSYATVRDDIRKLNLTQLVSKQSSTYTTPFATRKFTDIESYTLPRRRHSCDSSESYDDIIIPEFFNSPSRIKWNFLTGLPDHSRSHSQIASSDYKTDFDDDDECTKYVKGCKIEQILKQKSSSFDTKYQNDHRDKTVSTIWRRNSFGTNDNDCNAIIFHDNDSEVAENCCENHFNHDECKKTDCKDEDDSTVYEFELCTKENCEYLSMSQVMAPQQTQTTPESPLNNQVFLNYLPHTKNINLKHNKIKLKKPKKSIKSKSNASNTENDDFLIWSKLNFSHLMKKDSCNLNSVNLKPNSNSSSSNSLNHLCNRNLKARQKTPDKLFNTSLHRHQSYNITSLVLASNASTTARLSRNGIYFSNPDLINISDLTSSMNLTSNDSCQFINNDLRINNSLTVNSSQSTNSRFNNSNSVTNYMTVEESINSNNSNNSELMQQQHLRGRLRYNQYNINGLMRRAQRRAKKYFTSIIALKK